MKRIYIAGPLSSKTVPGYLSKVSTMLKIAKRVARMGYSPFIPCNDILLGILDGHFAYEDFFQMSIAFLEVCDAIFVIDTSPGVLREIELAKKLNIPIFRSLKALAENLKKE